MSKTKIGILVFVIIILGMVFIVFNSSKKVPPSPTEIGETNVNAEKTYLMNEVASHNNETNCWTVIDGNIYDVTSWIKEHPGGSKAIISLCGIDGSSAFAKKHGGQEQPEAKLQDFLIGKLK